jgi:hypothetical protein
MLTRVWPDRTEIAPAATAAVWCGPEELAPIESPTTFAPAGIPGRFQLGTRAPIGVPRCVSWFAEVALSVENATDAAPAGTAAIPALAPASLRLDDGSRVALEPTMLWPRSDVPPVAGSTCTEAEIPFGVGCAEVEDDRIVVRPPDDAVLWTLDAGQGAIVRSSRAGNRFVVRPMPIDARYRVATLDRSGGVISVDVSVRAAPPRPHVVLNEVMANPAGAEPSEEWVELFNDGRDAVSLAGFTLEDIGGRAVLPDGILEPGSYALVAPETYIADNGVDPVPADGTLILRVPTLGRGGLSNDGEPLTLRDPSGAVVSAFPAVKTKNGVSIARVAPDALDGDPDAFEPSPNGSATPGAPNGVP